MKNIDWVKLGVILIVLPFVCMIIFMLWYDNNVPLFISIVGTWVLTIAMLLFIYIINKE